MRELAEEWVRKAEADLVSARREFAATPPNHDLAAFLSQQSAEKMLKAVLQNRDVPFPKTHSLVELVALFEPPEPAFVALLGRLKDLAAAAVEVRYPGAWATREEAADALAVAEAVRQIALRLLGRTDNA